MTIWQVSFTDWYMSHGGSRMSIKRLWNPVAYALGFIDCDNISARCMLTIFQFFATKTEASLLRMLNGSPDMRLNGPIAKYITEKGGRYDRSFWSEDLAVMNSLIDLVCKTRYMCHWCCGMLLLAMLMSRCLLKVPLTMGLSWGSLWSHIRGRDICDWACDDKGECRLGIHWRAVFNMGFEKLLLCWAAGFHQEM